ncbi:hypothetical protein BDQ12DRAFT_679827 [Crucibulum laeve]|uniref:Transmembrane protein n=1 Tax=Crucibulum laeve TaxID=68775 RepID=A0A5C3M5R3_9AGAR|nr:hypothetical protein BDQ12DRAFT_679827 [Crucibulum laeve]
MFARFASVSRLHVSSFSGRLYATKTHRLPKVEEAGADFRPPWVYVTSRLLSFTVIPAVAFYAIFFYDFGDHDHVFQPARRWAVAQKAAFFTLSPAEERILKVNEPDLDVSTSSSETSSKV